MKYTSHSLILLISIYSQTIQAEPVTLYEIENSNIKRASLYYRVEGSQLYVSQPMQQSGSNWTASLERQQMFAPGIEYYIDFLYNNGETITEPASYPRYNPKRHKITKQKDERIQLTEQSINSEGDISFTVIGYADTETRVFIGDTDVTGMLQRNGKQWLIKDGQTILGDDDYLQLSDSKGNQLATTQITKLAEQGKITSSEHELILRGNASFNIGGQADDDSNSDSSLVFTGNLHLETEYNNGRFNSNFSGIDINYDHNAEDEFNLSSGFLLSNTFENHQFDIGDVSVSGAPLVLSGFSRRGLSYVSEGESWKGSLFNVRTSTVDGFESGVSFDDRQTYGVSYEQSLNDAGNTKLQLTAVSGELQQPQTDNVGSANNNSQAGDTVGLEYSAEYAGLNIQAQLAGSSFDANTSDAVNALSDEAYEISFTKDIYGLASSLGYQHYGANYATIANPNFSGDREGLNISFGSSWKFLNWTTSFSTSEDNIDRDATRAVVTSDNIGLTFDFVIDSFPGINLGFNLTNQSSKDEPNPADAVDSEGHDISLGLNDSFGDYNLSWGSSLGELENKLDPTNDSETSNHSMTIGYAINKVDINVNLSQNKNETDFILTSSLINLSLDIPFFSDDIVLHTNFSTQKNEANNNTQDNSIIGGSARISWTLHDIIMFKSMDWLNPQFGLSWTMNDTTDNLDNSLNVSDSTIMLDFSFGQPLDFEQRWKFDE